MKVKKFSPASTHLSLSGTFLVIISVLLLMGITVVASLSTQVFQGHAALQTFSSLAITGNIYIDGNRDGKQDNNEKNYTSLPRPSVKAILFNQECAPTPSVSEVPTVEVTEAPTPPMGCYYVKRCLGIMCPPNNKSCSNICRNTLVCPPHGVPTIPQGGGFGVILHGEQMGTTSNGLGAGNSIANGQSNDEQKTEQDMDVCHRYPLKVVDCPVTNDGTYSCIVTDVTFLSAMIRLDVPFGYKATSPNPVTVRAAAATVNFGIDFGGPIMPVVPGTVRSF
ncbi:MAG: hypothetical protein KGJ07_05110 [Patescibacteria group bacterium]|nr:hypothetical protein [Patescibacteria group bacterium]MDE2588713.1 hypothetical protein [Patescibacteria group bacterium]